MKNILYPIFILSVIVSSAQAQSTDSTLLNEQYHNKLDALPYYSFGKGIGMTSPDSLYQMNIRFRMQSRVSFVNENNEETFEALVRRLRLRFEGFVGDPKFYYAIQLSFSPNDVGRIDDGDDFNVIRDAMFFYIPNKHWQIGFGQTKLPGNRQRVNSSGALQLTDRSINNASFTIDRDFGLQVYYLGKKMRGMDFNLKSAVSIGEGRNWLQAFDKGLALTGRAELFPLGAFESNGAYFEGDLKREETPKVMIGATYHINRNALRTLGQRGEQLMSPTNISSFFLDVIAKYRGWAGMLAYMQRGADQIVSEAKIDAGTSPTYVYVGKGWDSQLSYLFHNHFEVIARYSEQYVNEKIRHFTPNQNQISLGLTKYIWEHGFKLQTEFTKNFYKSYDGSQTNDWYIRFQVEIGI